MNYTAFTEEVSYIPATHSVNVYGSYAVGGFVQTFEADVDTVTNGHNKLREFRQEFKARMKQAHEELTRQLADSKVLESKNSGF